MLLGIVQKINAYLSDYILVFLLIGVGLWYTVRTRFVQIRYFGAGMKQVFGNLKLRGDRHENGMSSFQALATAIAAQVGTGNIVGSAGAILTGGPGAIFWMWIIAFFGMATIYAEATLAIETRRKGDDGAYHGGPVYYITTAFRGGFGKFLAGFFAVAIILALGFMGCMVQSNSIGSTFETAFGIPSWIVGIVLVIVCAVIFLGGVQRLAAVTEKLVPVMAAVFLLGGLVVLVARIQEIPATFGMIFRYAFQPQAIIGGGFGGTIDNCSASGTVKAEGNEPVGLGGIGGCLEMMDSITNCTADVTIESANGGHAIGGLCGYAGTHSNPDVCLETEGFSTKNYPSVIDNCKITVSIKADGATHVGGLIGTGLYYYGEETVFKVTNCSVTGSIDGAVTPGTVAGRAVGSVIESCDADILIDGVHADNQIGTTSCMYESADQ
mgnify:CR=1 FL=1